MRIPLVAILLVTLIYFPLGENHSALYRSDEARKAVLEERWVDSVYQSLNDQERIAQLFMVRAHSDKGPEHEIAVRNLVEKFKVGGLCFFQGTPEKQAELTNLYQSVAKTPLLISMDAEWGLGMRLKENAISFPRQLLLGAVQDNRLIYEMGKEIARQCLRLGVHMNFAPVVDVNNNPNNPVINDRSFGEDRHNVTAKGFMYAMGMQDNGLLACAKHFPGHGDTDTDSHYDLPVIFHSKSRLDSIELYPFKVLAQHGLESMMMAHLSIPALDSIKNHPSSLSRPIVTNLLKDKLGFEGLIITDGLGMKGATKYLQPGEIEAQALIAGNDILLLPQDVSAAMLQINKAIEENRLSNEELENKVRKVLKAKYKVGLDYFRPVEMANLRADLNSPFALAKKEKLIKSAVTLVRDDQNFVPVQNLKSLKVSSIAIGSLSKTQFQKSLDHYAAVTHYNMSKDVSSTKIKQMVDHAATRDMVIVSLHDMSRYASKNFGISESAISMISQLQNTGKLVLVDFGNPYSLKYFDGVSTVLVAYDEEEMCQSAAAQAIFGAIDIDGKLPVTASPQSRFGMGLERQNLRRLEYSLPESAGLHSDVLREIDQIAAEAVRIKATPGCQVLVAKDGKVVYEKGFGYHTYSPNRPVLTTDIFDLASVTKIAATTLAMIKLQDEGKIDIYGTLGDYLPELKGSNKANLVIRDVMAHRAGLKAWIPFYEETLNKYKKPDSEIYRNTRSGKFNVVVTPSMFMHESYMDTVWKRIIDSDLRSSTSYKYSDLGFYLLSRLVNQVTGQSLDNFVRQNFYEPLGLQTTIFNPLTKFPSSRIIPSEQDNYFRHQTVQGTVHDMGAAMIGGVSGHAGLF